MKKYFIKILIYILISFLSVIYILYYPNKLNIKLIAIEDSNDLELARWEMSCGTTDGYIPKLKNVSIKIPDVDFEKNNLVISSYKIDSIRYRADQFVTFTLRAMGENDFDYTEGTRILIDKGIITQENAGTMECFTSGDMTKIIYEAQEKGLL